MNKSAKEMFENLGYHVKSNTSKVITYGMRRADETDVSVVFFRESQSYVAQCSRERYKCYSYSINVNRELHEAITQQLDEIEEERQNL